MASQKAGERGGAPDLEVQRQRREQLRRAAYEVIVQRGYHEASVDLICAAAKLSKGTFYWYYPSKQAVFLDLLDQWSREVEDEIRTQFSGVFEDVEPTTGFGVALAREARRVRAISPIWLESLAQSSRDPLIRQEVTAFYTRIQSACRDVLARFLSPQIPAPYLDALTASLLSAFVGLVWQGLVNPDGFDLTTTIRRSLVFLRTLLSMVNKDALGAALCAIPDSTSLPGLPPLDPA